MNYLHWLVIILHSTISVVAAGHALVWKRDPRAALGWIAVCLVFPLGGPVLYFLFGVNRIRTRAVKLQRYFPVRWPNRRDDDTVEDAAAALPPSLSEIVAISSAVSRRPIVSGNTIERLHNGEQAYPAMLAVVDTARRYLYLSTYIFETNATGRQFIAALKRAVDRGVDVRVIVDGIGELYSLPRAGALLKKSGVRVQRFLPPRLIPPALHINLRNHRKLLVCDDRVGFVGGMNIGDRHLAGALENPRRVIDLHFCLRGPIARQLRQVFLEDWVFCTGEALPSVCPAHDSSGPAACRAIVDGPNDDLDKLSAIIFGAVSTARRRVWIMTPYFLPSRELTAALQNAALRGVDVSVLLPGRNNLPFVHWATAKMLWQLLQKGARVYYQPPPFVHSKLFIIDDHYAQIGSANIDPRSLRLNFELAVEVYGEAVNSVLAPHFKQCLNAARPVTFEEVEARSIPVRIRDGLSWLFSPYL